MNMSSTETLTFGPQWLRNLSGGSGVVSPPASPAVPNTVKFKLAEYRYGREEMLALFEKQNEIPEELMEAPNLISEDPLEPMSLIPLTEDDQRALSGGVNSDVFNRGRGEPGMSSRGRSAPPRGRGRGRGDVYSRSMSQTDNGSGPPYSRGGPRESSRREGWEERGYRGRGGHDDGPSRKPIRRSDASEDWRSDANRGGGGDGNEGEDSRPEWRPPAPSRRDSWRDQGRSGSTNWRDSNSRDWSNEPPYRRPINRTRSLTSKYDGDPGLMPEWAEDADDAEVGVFSDGAFQPKKSSPSVTKTNSSDAGRASAKQISLKTIEEKERISSSGEGTSSPGKSEAEKPTKVDDSAPPKPNKSEKEPSPSPPPPGVPENVPDEKAKKDSDEKPPEPPKQPVFQLSSLQPPDATLSSATNLSFSASEQDKAQTTSEQTPHDLDVTGMSTSTSRSEHDDDHHLQHLEQAALKMVVSLSESDDHHEWGAGGRGKSPSLEPPTAPNPSMPGLALKWFYKDPQGDTQGPFGSAEMSEWFRAGYFTLNLLVKRACDPKFVPLGDLIAKWGQMPFDVKHGLSPQPSSGDLQLIALQQQQQKLQLQQQKLLQQQLLHQQQQQFIRSMHQQKQAYATVIQQLSASEEFRAMSLPQQQATLAQYAQMFQQQQQQQAAAAAASSSVNLPSAAPIHNLWDQDSSAARRPSPVPMVNQQQQQQIVELLKQKALEQEQLKKKQEELEEQKRRELMEQLMREEEQKKREREEEERQRREEEERKLKQMQEEALRLQAAEEALKKKMAEEAKKKQAELLREKLLQEEEEKLRKEEERIRKEKERRKEEEDERVRAKIAQIEEEEARMLLEQEEKRRKRKEALKLQQEEQKRVEEELKRKIEEEKEKQRKEKERLQQLQMEEERKQKEKQAQEKALRKQMEAQRQKEEAARKKQQEHLKNMKLPATANWANQQQQQPQTLSLSTVAEMQRKEEEKERKRREEQMRTIKQHQQAQQQQQQQKGVWGAPPQNGSSSSSNRPMSLMEIQKEESRKLQQKKKSQPPPPPQPKPEVTLQAAAWGGKQPTTTTTTSSIWGYSPAQTPGNLWNQPNASKRANEAPKPQQQTQPRGKQRSGSTSAESATVLNYFNQTSSQSDSFLDWCQTQLKKIPASKSLDVSTFVAFLRDIDSPYEVKDYIISYLGETKASREFAEGFIQQRNSHHKKQLQIEKQAKQQKGKKQEQGKKQSQPVPVQTGSSQSAAFDMEVVTGNTKRGKRKQKKLQKVDPSILGFSVNAASDRFNMGEIETPQDG